MNDLAIFRYEGADVRTILIDGEPWFVAADVARVLGYRMASDFTRRLDDDEKGTHSARTPGGVQDVSIISESGLYIAVIGSQTETARDFKRWITREVIPAIRKTGMYSADHSIILKTEWVRSGHGLRRFSHSSEPELVSSESVHLHR